MASRANTLADLVRDRLNAAAFSQSFTAESKAWPRFVLSAAGSLEVAVLVGPHERTRDTRGLVSTVLQSVPIVVRAKVAENDTATELAVGEYLQLVDEIEDDLFAGNGARLGDWVATAVTQSVPYDYEKLVEDGIFQAILTVQYRGLI